MRVTGGGGTVTVKIGQDVLGISLADNGSLLLQLGDAVTSAVTDENAESWGPGPGFASSPALPTPGKGACQTAAISGPDRDVVVGMRDTRAQKIYGNLGPGESCMFAIGPEGEGQARVVAKGDGSIVLFTTDDNTKTGNGVSFSVSPTEIAARAPWGYVVFDKTGFNVFEQGGGASLAIGPTSNPLQPNRIRLAGCCIRIDAPQVMIGPSLGNGGSGTFFAPALCPVPSVFIGVPTLIGAGLGVVMGFSSTTVMIGG